MLYIDNQSSLLDAKLIGLTVIAIISRDKALNLVVKEIRKLTSEDLLLEIASRKKALVPLAPPGLNEIITKR